MTSHDDVIVIGGGVLGLASAAELTARGLSVVVVDPGGPNASSIAAGMIAPAMESALEDAPSEVVEVLTTARALWPEFAARHRLDLIEDGAEWRGSDGEQVEERLRSRGFAVDMSAGTVCAPADARIHPTQAIAALRAVCRTAVSIAGQASRGSDGWTVGLEDGRRLTAAHLILATGAASALDGLPDSVARLISRIVPIRGQIARSEAQRPARSIRTAAGYVVPSAQGAAYGASMEPGRRDLEPDVASAVGQARRVAALAGTVVGDVDVSVGVRGAFRDGLPAVGALEGVIVALGPRRNGWLLAPLVARIVADAVQGRPPVPQAAALSPTRPALSPEG